MLSAYEDGHVVETERMWVAAHLASCSDCKESYNQLSEMRKAVRGLPARRVPPRLQMSLKAMASRESSRRRRHASLVARFNAWTEDLTMTFQDLMRPLAVPAFGGLVSSIVLFSMMMTNFQGIMKAYPHDVPTVLATEASVISSMDANFPFHDIMLDVYVDEQGRVIDYAFPEGYGAFADGALRRKLENALLFTRFAPATTFGQPTSGWVRVSFRRSEIDVKG